MYVTYKPEGSPQDEKSWEFDPSRVRVSEQVIVEKQYGERWSKFVGEVMAEEAKARRVLLWHLLRREHPALPWRDVPDFFDSELVIKQSLSELLMNYDAWVASGGPGNEHGPGIELAFQAEIEAAREREGGNDAVGKARSKSAPADTSG